MIVAKIGQQKGNSPDCESLKIQFLERQNQKQPPAETKMPLRKNSGHRSSEIVEEGSNNTCSSIKGSICQQHFSETKKRRLFSPDYIFEKN